MYVNTYAYIYIYMYILFADDSLIFCSATIEERDNVLEILKEYEEPSGQKMNRSKTSLFFSKSIPEEVKHGYVYV